MSSFNQNKNRTLAHLMALTAAMTVLSACGGSSGDSSVFPQTSNPPSMSDGNPPLNATPPAPDNVVPAIVVNNDNINDVPENTAFYASHPGSARLSGPTVGQGTYANSDLVKKLNNHGPLNGERFKVLGAYAVNAFLASSVEGSELIAVLQNTSDTALCSYSTYFGIVDNEGNIMRETRAPIDFTFANEGTTYSDFTSNGTPKIQKCIPPGAIVHASRRLTGGENSPPIVDYDDIAGITKLETRDSIFNVSLTPEATLFDDLVPLSYTRKAEDDFFGKAGSIDVLVQNNNPTFAITATIAVIALDNDGSPVHLMPATILNTKKIEPGQTGVMSVNTEDFLGSSNNLRVIVHPRFIHRD